MRYRIDFYKPNSRSKEAIHRIEAAAPFMPLQRDDLINPSTWSEKANLASIEDLFKAGCVLRVRGIEHHFISNGNGIITHCIGVYTEAIENVPASRA